ncbi:unnamed protein product [Heterobilharzia americana]|nr:unnamed protein product [Heterobilharzia americana]
MENNLYEKNMKFCETLAYNNKIRHEIECARNERNIYYSIHQKLKDKLIHLNKMKTKLIQQASIIYDQRTDAKNKNERSEWKQKAENRRRKYGSTGEIARQQRSQKIQEYESTMNQLQSITEKSDVDQMTRYYKRNEDDNFTLFKYVTELNNQIECLNDNITNIEKNMKEYREKQKEVEKQRNEKITELKAQIHLDKEMADSAQNRATHIHTLLDQIKTEIKQLAVKLGCDLSRIIEMLGGDGDQITERNLMLYLSALEQKVDELLSVKCYTHSKEHGDEINEDDLKIIMAPSFTETLKTNRDLSITLPSLMDEDDTNDDDTPVSIRPLSQLKLSVVLHASYRSRSKA